MKYAIIAAALLVTGCASWHAEARISYGDNQQLLTGTQISQNNGSGEKQDGLWQLFQSLFGSSVQSDRAGDGNTP